MSEPNPKLKKKKQNPSTQSQKKLYWIVSGFMVVLAFVTFFCFKTMMAQHNLLLTLKEQVEHNNTVSQSQWLVSKNQIQQQLNQQNQMEKQVQVAIHACKHVSTDWRISRTIYLLELAQENATWTHDPKTTIALLEQAKLIFSDVPYTMKEAIQDAFNHEILDQKKLLTLLQSINVNDLFSQLNALEQHIAKLQYIPSQDSSSQPNPLPQHPQNITSLSWYQRLKLSIQSALNHLVTIRRFDALQHDSLHTLEDEDIIRAMTQLNIERAKSALMDHNEVIYAESLQQAIVHLESSFARTSADAQTILSELNRLKTVQIAYPKNVIPKITLQFIRQLKQTQNHAIIQKGA